MNSLKTALCITTICLIAASTVQAHFGMVIPNQNIITQEDKNISVTLSFSHPFEGIGMDLVSPKHFYVVNGETKTDLLNDLQPATVMDHKAWKTGQQIKRPGIYQYIMEPQPYWEPAEDIFIIHYTKTIVAAFGENEGWEQEVGLPTEIVPLLRPFGNYAGNTFVGQVLMDGSPVPQAEVEVELYNRDGHYISPSDFHITQVVKADDQGVFSFTCPVAGWWGFSALNEADYTIKGPDNSEKTVEIGAVIWLYFDSFTSK